MTSLLVAVGGAVLVLAGAALLAFTVVTAFHVIAAHLHRGEDA